MIFVLFLYSSWNTRLLPCFKQTDINLRDINRYDFVDYVLTPIREFFFVFSSKCKLQLCEASHRNIYRGFYLQRNTLLFKITFHDWSFKYITCLGSWIKFCLHCIKLFSAELKRKSKCLPRKITWGKEFLREWKGRSSHTKKLNNHIYLWEVCHNQHTESKTVSLPFMSAKFGNKKESILFIFKDHQLFWKRH